MTTLSNPTATAAVLTSFDPATGERVGDVPVTPVDRVKDVVAAARAARVGRDVLEERAAALRPAGQRLVECAEEIGHLLSREMGKPLAEAIGEVKYCGSSIEKKLAEVTEALKPEPFGDDALESTVYHDAFGVCAAITPWNFPMAMPHSIVIPALMAGNTVVLKPSEETPLVAEAYVNILSETLPENVFQSIHGADDQGKTLVESDVDLIGFTGSAATGKHILGAASPDLKRVILELGGKDPMIVLDDACIDDAAKFAVNNSFRNAGQVCVSTERIYVEDRIADDFEQAVAKLAGDMKVGPGLEPDVKIGPMINTAQRDHVLRQIDAAVADGANVISGGTGHHDNFIVPTVLTNVNHDMGVMTDETFGPVACIMRVKNADEAVTLANDTPYGLGAAVFGGDRERTDAVARRLTAGMVGINKGCGGAAGTPWVGARESGFGFHGGRDGHRQFAQVRVVSRPKG